LSLPLAVSVGSPSLSARVLVTVPVTVSCSPFDPSLTVFSESIGATVEQASGRAIARGSSQRFAFTPAPLLFACDGSTTTIPVEVSADTTGVPFHGGNAIVSASASASAGTCFGTVCFGNTSQFGSAGPVSVRL
jgi:hypothetical protein